MTHEIAAAFIVGGFIIAYHARATKGDFWRGMFIVAAACLSAMGHL